MCFLVVGQRLWNEGVWQQFAQVVNLVGHVLARENDVQVKAKLKINETVIE